METPEDSISNIYTNIPFILNFQMNKADVRFSPLPQNSASASY